MMSRDNLPISLEDDIHIGYSSIITHIHLSTQYQRCPKVKEQTLKETLTPHQVEQIHQVDLVTIIRIPMVVITTQTTMGQLTITMEVVVQPIPLLPVEEILLERVLLEIAENKFIRRSDYYQGPKLNKVHSG